MNKFAQKIPFEKQIHWIIISGLIWGLIELFLAPVIRSYARGLFGILMPLISITFMLSVKYRMPAKGTIFLSAIIASLIKLFLSGMVLTGGFMAILVEAALIEIVYSFSGFTLWGYISSGILVQLYSAFHPYITKGLLCQSTHFVFFKRFLSQNFNLLLEKESIIFTLISIHILAGITTGLIAWWIITFLVKKETS